MSLYASTSIFAVLCLQVVHCRIDYNSDAIEFEAEICREMAAHLYIDHMRCYVLVRNGTP